MKRRSFIASLAVSAAAAGVAFPSDKTFPEGPTYRDYDDMLLPLSPYSTRTIGIAAPASSVTTAETSQFVALCNSWGYKVKYGRNVSRRMGYLSAPDEERATEFMELINDPDVGAIVCGRGGYGVMRILPMLDYAAIRRSRKVIMGFSDITALLLAIYRNSRLLTFHGPVASSTFNALTTASMAPVFLPNTNNPTPTNSNDIVSITDGVARGRLTGGNLSMIVATLGTAYEIDTQGSILFLEETSEEPYRIDRMLTQLWLAGKLQSCNGIAIGVFRDCEAKGSARKNLNHSLAQVLNDRIRSLNIPSVYGLPFGHVKSKLTLPVGGEAELNAGTGTLTLLSPTITHPTRNHEKL